MNKLSLKSMNSALCGLLNKYSVPDCGEMIVSKKENIGPGVCLKLNNGQVVNLLPWRVERRFIELKKLIEDHTLEDVSTLRFCAMSTEQNLIQLLYREFDLCSFLGRAPVKSVFAVGSGGKTANVIVKLENNLSCSVECAAQVPGIPELDRHEVIARRGIACDRTVDTQIPQSSIYAFTEQGEQHYTDTDAELFGLSNAEIVLVRAAFQALTIPATAAEWNSAHEQLIRITASAMENKCPFAPAIFTKEK